MKKTEKRITAALLTAILIVLLLLQGCAPASYSLSADIGEATPETLWRDAGAVVLAEPTGRVSRFTAGSVRFRLTDVEITGVLRGASEGDKAVTTLTIPILQTEGLKADISLKKGQRYLLFLDTYKPGSVEGMEKAEGAYTVKGAFKGVYELDAHGNLTAVRTSYETQEQTAAREAEMCALLDSISLG